MRIEVRFAVMLSASIAIAMLAGACMSPEQDLRCGDRRCADGEICRVVETTTSVQPMCVREDGNDTGGDRCVGNCPTTVCGDGVVSAGEICDDGNASELDGCKRDCTAGLRAYLKASNTHENDGFGASVALSADGLTLAVGAAFEDGAAAGVDGDQTSDAAPSSGAVYVFTRTGAAWVQQAYIKASNPGLLDDFGSSVALSADGSTLAVGATGEASAATGVDGDQSSNAADSAGAVYVFTRSGTAWTQEAYLKASNPDASDQFGSSLALSADGSTLVTGVARESSAATGINGNQTDNTAPWAGAAYVFARSGTTWTQQAYLKASNSEASDEFGIRVALSADGSILAVGAPFESSAATGIDGDQSDNSAPLAGAVYVFERSDTTWTQQAYIKSADAKIVDGFGVTVALSGDGSTLAVGAMEEAHAWTGEGDPTDDPTTFAGAAYVFRRSGATWLQQAYLKASNADAHDFFGSSIALSADGFTLAVGAYGEASATTGIGGDQTDNSAPSAGAAYVFTRRDATWTQQAYMKASNTNRDDFFSYSLALSGDGSTLAVGAIFEASSGIGVDSDQADNTAPLAGAAYLFY